MQKKYWYLLLIFIFFIVIFESLILIILNTKKNQRTKIIKPALEKKIDLYGVFILLDDVHLYSSKSATFNYAHLISGRVRNILKAEENFDNINKITNKGVIIHFPYIIYPNDSTKYVQIVLYRNKDCNDNKIFINESEKEEKISFDYLKSELYNKTVKIELLTRIDKGGKISNIKNKYQQFVGYKTAICD